MRGASLAAEAARSPLLAALAGRGVHPPALFLRAQQRPNPARCRAPRSRADRAPPELRPSVCRGNDPPSEELQG